MVVAIAGFMWWGPLGAQAPKPVSKMTYVIPYNPFFTARNDAQFAAEVAQLKSRLGEGPWVRVGFNLYLFVSMDRWELDPADRATVRANLATTFAQVDFAVTRAKANGIPLALSVVTPGRKRTDPLQVGAEREDRRNVQWYANGDIATGWVSVSRYARKMRGRFDAYIQEVGAYLANRMARDPATFVAASGDGEVELSLDRDQPLDAIQITDYSPFAIAEFRDWLRNGGLYAPGQPYAGQGYANAARYQGDASPAVDTNGDGRTLNGDFGTAFTSWTLRHFDWSLSDGVEVDAQAIPALTYERPGFNALPGTDPTRFDAPRVRQPGVAWWEVWDRFRQEMVWHYNIDFARHITTTVDAETRATVPSDRWYSHQIPADYLFGFTPENPNPRLITSASPHWTADISPYGGLGITSFNVHLGGTSYAKTLATVIPHIAARNRRWAILEWNPSLPASTTIDVYRADTQILEQYRPSMVVPWAWGYPDYAVLNSPFETALAEWIARIKDGPRADAPVVGAPTTLAPPDLRHWFTLQRALNGRDAAREAQARTLPRAPMEIRR